MSKRHLWQGIWIDDKELQENINNISKFTTSILGDEFPLEYFLELSQNMHEELLKEEELYRQLLEWSIQTHSISSKKAEGMLQSITMFLSKGHLEKKLLSELGDKDPFTLKRPSLKQEHFESWMPLGTLVHIAPTNVFTVGILCVIEGLLSGNINILKTSKNQHQLPQLFFEALLKFDTKNLIKPYIIVLEVSSKEKELLQQIINCADVVSAWGSEEAIKSVQDMTPQGVRFVPWGHKISFAYFAHENLDDKTSIEQVCEDICLLDQNACSSPQNVFVESSSFEELKIFAQKFATILEKVSKKTLRTEIDSAQQAEISTLLSISKTEEALGLTCVLQADDFSWAVIADRREGLSVSPLFRTIIIKQLNQKDIISTLHPMKSYLQTAALIAPKERVMKLSKLFFGAGCLRIREAGCMHDGYIGEPHDGVYALPSFMKRTSLRLTSQLKEIATFKQFQYSYIPNVQKEKILDKKTFQAMEIENQYIDLTFKSGGSSGKTTYSYFTYEDYNTQMKATAFGLFSAGLDPKKDTVINMFAAGHLYGGFLSFFSILEHLEVPQYPMGLVENLKEVGEFIVEKRINTVLSAPSFIMKLFKENKELFKKKPVIKKIFFGGDHFSDEQIAYLKKEFKVEFVRAAAYGSNDAGPLGYQCPHCKPNEYHLLSTVQSLEVFDINEDRLAQKEEIGRLIFSSKQRKGQNIIRYDVGDTGYLHEKPCKCGRLDAKFSLFERSSDAFKAGGPFLHFDKFSQYLKENYKYNGLIQILLQNVGVTQKLTLKVSTDINSFPKDINQCLMENYEELKMSVKELGVKFEVDIIKTEDFETVTHSGKVRHIIDTRNAK